MNKSTAKVKKPKITKEVIKGKPRVRFRRPLLPPWELIGYDKETGYLTEFEPLTPGLSQAVEEAQLARLASWSDADDLIEERHKAAEEALLADITFTERLKSRSGRVPPGDVRLTINIRDHLHQALKDAAANGASPTTMGELIEEWIKSWTVLEPNRRPDRIMKITPLPGGGGVRFGRKRTQPWPEYNVRLTVNIARDLHTELKARAANERTTMGNLIERWIENLL